MNFAAVNYSFLLQDFVFAMGAGFAAGGIVRLVWLFLPTGKIWLWIKDMLAAFIFSVVVFSYVISFANYPDIRIYHLLGAFFGFLSFNFNFSTIFHKILKKFTNKFKNKMLCYGKKVYRTVCDLRQKVNHKYSKRQKVAKNDDLKNDEIWVYNL